MARPNSDLTEEEQWELRNIKQQPSRYNAKTIGTVMRRLMSQRGYGQTELADALSENWKKCAGDRIASVTRPGKISRGVLYVHADNSAVLQELNFEKKRILNELKKRVPELKLKDLRAKAN